MKADITPDKSLIKKLGLSGYKTEQALAELVDNSIDARIPGRTENIAVRLDFVWHRITVTDDGLGMNEGELAEAMVIARSTKAGRQLGRFGMGLKGACSALGRRFEIITSQEDSAAWHRIRYDEEDWLGDASKGWDNFEVEEVRPVRGEEDWHGTRVEIDLVTVPIYPNQTTRFKERFGVRYSPYIESGQVSIKVNTLECKPRAPVLADGTRWKPVHMQLASGMHIVGRLGLLKTRSVGGGGYGIHLFKNGRLIRAFEKFGFPAHPENAQLIGELNLDHVPVNFNKSRFIEESRQYAEALNAFKKSDALSKILRSSKPIRHAAVQVDSIMSYFNGQGPAQHLERHIRASESAKALAEAAGKAFSLKKPGGAQVQIRFEPAADGPLYTISIEKEVAQVGVNTNSPMFRMVGNPALLIALIASESELVSKDPDRAALLLKDRNARMDEFVREWTCGMPADAGKAVSSQPKWRYREPQLPDIHGYGLHPDLLEIHDHLRNSYEMQFQFTALSTLRPYLHNLLGKVVYTVHTTRGNGDELAGCIMEKFGGRVSAVDRPTTDTIFALFYSGPTDIVVAVREYAGIPNSTVAMPAKALVDLVIEKDVHKAPISGEEPRMVLYSMLRHGLVSLAEVRRQARRVKQSGRIEEIIEAGPA